jgi:hypothetical protein
VLDVPHKLAARVRLLATGDVNKNDPGDARSVAVAALRSAQVREVRRDDHAAVLKVWSLCRYRHKDHLIRSSLCYASRTYWVPLSKDLRPVCTAAGEQAAAAALDVFAAAWGDRYPAIVKLWRAHWAEFTPFLAFPPEVRGIPVV